MVVNLQSEQYHCYQWVYFGYMQVKSPYGEQTIGYHLK